MIQRGIGVFIGALVSLVLLTLMTDVAWDQAVVPLAIGAIAAWAWPLVIAFWLGRRAKQHRDDRIEDEVQRQLDQQNRGG
jgi:ABC-type uncharacterized transport system permease subunit